MGRPNGGVRVLAPDSQVPAGAGVPPEYQGLDMVLPEVNMKIEMGKVKAIFTKIRPTRELVKCSFTNKW